MRLKEHHCQQDVKIISYYEPLRKRPWYLFKIPHQGGNQASLKNADFFKKRRGVVRSSQESACFQEDCVHVLS